MSKRKPEPEQLEEQIAVASEPEAAEPEPEIEPQQEEESLYDTRSWNGIPQYLCRVCGHDTLSLPKMLAHIEDAHQPKPLRAPSVLTVTDRFGNIVEEREV